MSVGTVNTFSYLVEVEFRFYWWPLLLQRTSSRPHKVWLNTLFRFWKIFLDFNTTLVQFWWFMKVVFQNFLVSCLVEIISWSNFKQRLLFNLANFRKLSLHCIFQLQSLFNFFMKNFFKIFILDLNFTWKIAIYLFFLRFSLKTFYYIVKYEIWVIQINHILCWLFNILNWLLILKVSKYFHRFLSKILNIIKDYLFLKCFLKSLRLNWSINLQGTRKLLCKMILLLFKELWFARRLF